MNKKLWITGHSRGGAVANLLAADLNRPARLTGLAIPANAFPPQNDIYAYTFATPNVVQESFKNKDGDHSNIWNFNNPLDLVAYFPFSGWGYTRFGTTVPFDVENLRKGTKREAFIEKFKEYAGYPSYDTMLTKETIENAVNGIARVLPRNTYVDAFQAQVASLAAQTVGKPPANKDQAAKQAEDFLSGLTGLSGLDAAVSVALGKLLSAFAGQYAHAIIGHTPEMYVVLAEFLAFDKYIRGATTLYYRRSETYTMNNAQGKVTWSVDHRPLGEGQAITVHSQKKDGGFSPPRSKFTFILTAVDEVGSACAMPVEVKFDIMGWVIYWLLLGWLWGY